MAMPQRDNVIEVIKRLDARGRLPFFWFAVGASPLRSEDSAGHLLNMQFSTAKTVEKNHWSADATFP